MQWFWWKLWAVTSWLLPGTSFVRVGPFSAACSSVRSVARMTGPNPWSVSRCCWTFFRSFKGVGSSTFSLSWPWCWPVGLRLSQPCRWWSSWDNCRRCLDSSWQSTRKGIAPGLWLFPRHSSYLPPRSTAPSCHSLLPPSSAESFSPLWTWAVSWTVSLESMIWPIPGGLHTWHSWTFIHAISGGFIQPRCRVGWGSWRRWAAPRWEQVASTCLHTWGSAGLCLSGSSAGRAPPLPSWSVSSGRRTHCAASS